MSIGGPPSHLALGTHIGAVRPLLPRPPLWALEQNDVDAASSPLVSSFVSRDGLDSRRERGRARRYL